ncbi:MAG TPA: hypothetical protein PLD47_10445 [Aggregatilineales bacterium]|nr:hypothetical protein [Anaerolineales bacterium]HRE48134.1 hypothetical protein [Aggregatilineales bacterium]
MPNVTPAPPKTASLSLSPLRLERMGAGLETLALWLCDLIEGGFNAFRIQRNQAAWDEIITRMVDAELPGVVSALRRLKWVSNTRAEWADYLLEGTSRLYLMAEAFQRRHQLTEPEQADLYLALGCQPTAEEIASAPAVKDTWYIVGLRSERDTESHLPPIPPFLPSPPTNEEHHVHRIWLWGAHSRRWALLSVSGWALKQGETLLAPGNKLKTEIVYFPSMSPLRGALRHVPVEHLIPDASGAITPPLTQMRGEKTPTAALDAAARRFAQNPWLERLPFLLEGVTPILREDGRWAFAGAAEEPIIVTSPLFRKGWEVLAVSGGKPVTLFGEWNGSSLFPLAIFTPHQTVWL